MRVPSKSAILGVAVFLSACAYLPGAARQSDPAPTLTTAHTVFLGELGGTADAELARTLLREELERRGRFSVVSAANEADAVLRGEIVLRRAASGRPEGARVFGTLQLLSTGSNHLLWRHVYSERSVVQNTPATTPTELLQRAIVQLCDQLERDADLSVARR